MDKEKEIERIDKILVNAVGRENVDRFIEDEQGNLVSVATVSLYALAKDIINSGYGNVKQAVKDFAENIIELLDEMGMERSSEYNDGYDDGVADCITNIKSRITELYGVANAE